MPVCNFHHCCSRVLHHIIFFPTKVREIIYLEQHANNTQIHIDLDPGSALCRLNGSLHAKSSYPSFWSSALPFLPLHHISCSSECIKTYLELLVRNKQKFSLILALQPFVYHFNKGCGGRAMLLRGI